MNWVNFAQSGKYSFLLLLTGLFISCHKSDNTLKITFSRACKGSSAKVRAYDFSIESNDSVLYSPRIPMYYGNEDTLKLDSLPAGVYEIKYKDILGRGKVKSVRLGGAKQQLINIVLDSIDTSRLLNKTPIATLKEGESYTVETKGGCVATMYSFYKISKDRGQIYFESVNIPKRSLTISETVAVKEFEAELLAINGVNSCMSTGRMTYKILKDKDTTTIIDNTCNWAGLECVYAKILRNRFKNK